MQVSIEEDLRRPFESHGTLTDVYNPGKGFAFITFATPAEAQAAIKAMDGTQVCGRDIQCSLARKRKEESKAVMNLKMRVKHLESQNALLK